MKIHIFKTWIYDHTELGIGKTSIRSNVCYNDGEELCGSERVKRDDILRII